MSFPTHHLPLPPPFPSEFTDTPKPIMTSNDNLFMGDPTNFTTPNDKNYALSGKIMLSAIVILFFVVILMVCLHLYARWYLLRARRRNQRRNRNRRNHLVFHMDTTTSATAAATRGLDPAVLNSLPIFVFSSKTQPDSDPNTAMECAVCLSEFEENEMGRRLPKCNHNFHTECIDMWFHSHSTCPLCRSPVEPGPNPELEILTEVCVAEPARIESGHGSSSGLCSECDRTSSSSSSAMGSSSFGARRKPFELVGVSIEVPRRNESFGRIEEESSYTSPSGQTSSFRSPMSRMLSFKRILSRDKRGSGMMSPSGSGTPTGYSAVNELDIERGKDVTH
ncbi:RING-H2 finger protein ATL2 [Cannabis sativa]|uniref:RING-H2 finger protein ATL2 n=1 Tax=Cannabis sativa TaxID=3483 RepID=UPI0029CA0580|nr:RING-H2 finger protein ATL2 [Cannabis sativa]